MSFISTQREKFKIFNSNAKRLLQANLLFGLLVPFYVIFSNTFIFGNTDGDLNFNIIYSALHFLGNPIGFIMNGFFLRRFHVKSLFIAGMAIIIVNMALMMFLPAEFFTELAVLGFGLVSGIGSGMYWSARTYLTVVSTDDESRNFFSGLDFMFLIAGGIVTPFIIGNYIGLTIEYGILSRPVAYQSAILFALILVSIASFIVAKGKFETVKIPRFLYYSFEPSWKYTRWFVFIMGIFHGAYLSLPAILMMTFVGNESDLGIVDSTAHIIAIIAIYIVSSNSKTEHRTKIMMAGSILFLAGSFAFGAMLSSLAVVATILLVVTFYLTDPTINFPYRASFMKGIDHSKSIEGKDEFSYVVDIEQFNALGRLVSIGVFFIFYQTLPQPWAFPVYISLVAVIQFANLYFSKKINAL